MISEPRLRTIEMVRETIERHSGDFSRYQLWKNLPKKMMYQTFQRTLEYLSGNNEIALRDDKKIEWRNVTKKLELSTIKRETIVFNLSHYGYDLITLTRPKKQEILPLEELILQILIRFPETRFIEAIPILMIKNKLDQFELYRAAYDNDLINKLGFLLEASFKIAKNKNQNISYLRELFQNLILKKNPTIQRFSNSKDVAYLKKNTPLEMKKWNLIGLFSFHDFHEANL